MSKSKAKNPNPYAKPQPRKTPWAMIIVACCVVVGLVVGLTLGLNSKKKASAAVDPVATNHIEIEVQDYGTIKAELFGNMAPITVNNFLNLVKEGFYDGLTFHRIISGFMIQGGDPLGTGTGGSTNKIKGEFSRNGVTNELKHVRGVISMARSNDPDSASSQFFIMHQDAPHLDGNYASFGKVTSGMEIVDKIAAETPVQDSNGTVLKADQPVINSIKIIE